MVGDKEAMHRRCHTGFVGDGGGRDGALGRGGKREEGFYGGREGEVSNIPQASWAH